MTSIDFTIEDALSLAIEAHNGQVDLDGMPVILHPLAVGLKGTSFDEIVAGFLHDVVEDSDLSIEELISKGVPKRICDVLKALTHKEGNTYQDYLNGIVRSGNKTAMRVKINDLEHNISRNDRKTENKERIYQKHKSALKKLKEACL